MPNLIIFGFFFILAYLLQSFLTFRQIKEFNRNFQTLRKRGKVVTGKKGGRLIAGTVILFLIDDEGVIIEGAIMQGISVFAKFKPFLDYNGQQLMALNRDHASVKAVHRFTALAIENARELYIRFLTGTIDEPNHSHVTPFGINLSVGLMTLKSKFRLVVRK